MESKEQTWTTVDKADWGDGPWQDECDKVQWIDDATDLDCLIVRGPMGSLCGYVGLPPGHPYHGAHYDTPEGIDVHGGLTYSDHCMEGLPEGEGICHIPAPGRPADVWWVGFDCGHTFDLSPAMAARMREIRARPDYPPTPPAVQRLLDNMPLGMRDVYRTIDYVRDEVTRLAAQLAT